MAGHIKSSSETNLSLSEEQFAFERPIVNFSFRKLPRRSNSMPSVMADNMSAHMKEFIAEINNGVDKLKDTLLETEDSSTKLLNDRYHNGNDSYDIIDSEQNEELYKSKKVCFSSTGNDTDSTTELSVDALIEAELRPDSINQMSSKRDALSDIQFEIDRNNWFGDKDILISKIEKAKSDYKENIIAEYDELKKDLEYEIVTLRGENKSLEQELKHCRENEKLRTEENRKIFDEHQKELQKFKKEGLQDSKKQVRKEVGSIIKDKLFPRFQKFKDYTYEAMTLAISSLS